MIGTITTIFHSLKEAVTWIQYKWKWQEHKEHEREKAEAKAEQFRKERLPPLFLQDGSTNRIRITGSQHSVQGPFVDLWGTVTVLNPTQAHMTITPQRLVVDGADWTYTELRFHLKSKDRERCPMVVLVSNEKQDYNMHFFFPDDKYPKGLSGDLWLTSSNREDEAFSIPISFA